MFIVYWESQFLTSFTHNSNEKASHLSLCGFALTTGTLQSCYHVVFRTNWASNPYTRGSYSCLSLEFDPKFFSVMLEPLYHEDKPIVLFAGEAYHPTFYSAMHGAYATGLQQAEVISKYINGKQS